MNDIVNFATLNTAPALRKGATQAVAQKFIQETIKHMNTHKYFRGNSRRLLQILNQRTHVSVNISLHSKILGTINI